MRDGTNPSDWRSVVDARLVQIADGFGSASPVLGRAMSDATLAPGKRFRATVLLIAGESTGGVQPALIDAACAVEMVHAASLVFDDLPCMDDARMRRGRPTTHLVYGECRAILSGVALVTEGMRVLATARGAEPTVQARLVATLAAALGPHGLCAGQDLDLHAAKDPALIEREQDLKTGALFAAGFEMFGMIQRLDAAEIESLAHLGRILGRAFQSYDDLLDVRAEAGTLGKDTGRDAQAPGPARGLLAVRSLPQAQLHYDGLRAELDTMLENCSFDSLPLAAYIARVLPARTQRDTKAYAS